MHISTNDLHCLPLVLNHVESKWTCAVPACVLAQKDPSTRRNLFFCQLQPTGLLSTFLILFVTVHEYVG